MRVVATHSTFDVDFAKLSLMDTLDLAILMEEEARERYEELAVQLEFHNTDEAARFFRMFAAQEAEHEEKLSRRRKQLFGDQQQVVERSMLWEVEAPRFEEARTFMSPRQALEVAMTAEQRAYQFYESALPEIRDPEVAGLFEELRDEELAHQEQIRSYTKEVPSDSKVDLDDYVDPPRGQ
jgi:rubrerythrin